MNGVGRGLASEGRALPEAGGSEHVGAAGRAGLKEARGSARLPLPPNLPVPSQGWPQQPGCVSPHRPGRLSAPFSLPTLAAAWLCLAEAEINWICSLILKGICGPQQGCWNKSWKRFVDSRVVLLPLAFLFHLCCVGQTKGMKRSVNLDADRDVEKRTYKKITLTHDGFCFETKRFEIIFF